jgi:hypothetical protein
MMNMTITAELMHYALRNHLSRLKDNEVHTPVVDRPVLCCNPPHPN